MTVVPTNRVISSVQITSVRLAKMEAAGPPHGFVVQGEQATINVKHKAGIIAVPNETGRFDAIAEFLVEVIPEGSKDLCFSIRAIFELAYVLPPSHEYTDEEMKEFVTGNVAFNAWPYFRELVQSTSTRMGLAAITLPLFRHGQPLSAISGKSDQKEKE
jgi:hypothetical protein